MVSFIICYLKHLRLPYSKICDYWLVSRHLNPFMQHPPHQNHSKQIDAQNLIQIVVVECDYIVVPNLTLPPEKVRPIGLGGHRRLRYLKQHHKVFYYNLLTSGKLHSHLASIE